MLPRRVTVVHLDGDIHRKFAIGITQNPPQAIVKIKFLSRQVKTRPLRLPRITFFVDLRRSGQGGHKIGLRMIAIRDVGRLGDEFPR